MCIVHCRVIVDNRCEFQHSSSHVDCNFDARLVSKTRKYRFTKETEKARLPTDSCLNNSKRPSLVNCISTNPECPVSALSVIARSWAPKVFANFKLGVSQFTKFCVASCHCVAPCPCFASCNCCHDPFIVRSAQTVTGFTQPTHPSRCSRSTLTTVCFCARVSVFTSAAPSPDSS